MIYCKVESGVVVNRAAFDVEMPADWPEYDSYVQDDVAQIGWTYADGIFSAPPQPPPLEPPPPPLDHQVMFDHENRLRTIEGQPLLEFDEFVATKLMPYVVPPTDK